MMWYIVGKGPSLRYLRAEHFGDGPVIALNESILTVEALGLSNPLISMQVDGAPESAVVHPADTTHCVHDVTRSPNSNLDHPDRELINPETWGFLPSEVCVMCAVEYAFDHRATSLTLLCFDSYTNEDYRTYEPVGGEYVCHEVCAGTYTYANKRLRARLHGVDHTFVTPVAEST